jgi:hypothetical protein
MYLYILYEREFINLNKNIYKIDLTSNNLNIFINTIPKNSNIYFFSYINDENISIIEYILKIFRSKFKNIIDIGENYFEGEVKLMIEIINHILYNKIYKDYKIQIKDNIYWWED